LGRLRFEPGAYFYTGSARRAIEARVRRHLRRSKRRRWHIDHLLGTAGVRVDFVLICDGDEVGGECGLHRRALSALGASTPHRGFGSSDCKGGCPAHLGRLKRACSAGEVLGALGLRGKARIFSPREGA